jgi:hypothetical protein
MERQFTIITDLSNPKFESHFLLPLRSNGLNRISKIIFPIKNQIGDRQV